MDKPQLDQSREQKTQITHGRDERRVVFTDPLGIKRKTGECYRFMVIRFTT